MSSSNRTSSKGGKNKNEKNLRTDKIDTGKASGDKIMMKENPKSEDLKSKVQRLIEMTQRSEEEVCLALHDCNNDLQQAVNMLYETMTESQWSVKKKKSRQPGNKQEKQSNDETANTDEWNENQGTDNRDKPRSKSGGPNYRRGGDGGSRGWRGREKQENERNLDPDGRNEFGRDRRGRPGGSGGGRGGGRGGRGGGRGRYPPRGGSNRNNSYNRPIDTWDNNNPNTWDNNTLSSANPVEETWDDFPGTDEWSTEEYTGSLADTKIFTPSANVKLDIQMENQHEGPLDTASQQLSQTLQINQQSGPLPSQSPVPMVGTLNAAQTKYLNQLTQQNSDNYSNIQTFQSQSFENPAQQYNTGAPTITSQGFNNSQNYGAQPTNTYVNSKYPANYGTSPESVPSQQPLRTKTQRARVPPPSKIPSSAVEMPGDLNSSIGYLDVQFGAMDFMSDSSSFDGVVDQKYGSTNNSSMENAVPQQSANLDLNNSNQNSNLDAYSPKSNVQSSINSALTQNLSNVENIPTSDHVTGTGSYTATARTSAANSAAQSSTSQAVLDMSKQTDGHSYTQNSTYNSYQSKSYNSTYNANQTTTNSYQPSSNYVNSQAGAYSTPSANNYQNSYSSATSYQSSNNSAAFPSITQANSYSGTNQSYSQSASQSVYGANTGLNNSSTYGSSSSASQYNNYSSAANKMKDTVYDSTNASSSAPTTTATSIVSSSATLSLSQNTVSTSKTTTTTLAAKNSSNVVSNMPPGVAPPVMSTPYNMVQVPYYQQPLYSYEEMQLLQQRLPHMTTPFYDMSYQTPTTLATVRDATLGNVGYSMSDGRFTRGDNNASPVPSTLSQQTSTQAGHQAQPILAGTAAPPYFFAATHFNTIPNYPFYQLPAVTNAHGTNSNSQYPKPGGYSSGYGAYDALSQTQDYTKGAYVGNTQGQKATSGAASSTGSTGNDLTAMYGKSHTALGKVNSYEKQGFHSGTPPPFSGTLHGSQNAGLAPSGTGYAPPVYIPAMAPHQQHHSTQLMHQPLHQMDVRHQGRRVDSSTNSGQRSQTSNQAKASGKQYTGSYWNQS
ncbi:protein lingerer isoform X3 [Coccinella septempunctata]|uniref:protein lingerer isoform X3 n=1 Tax=Coccinella septempunctata TaxID=41139 RepID=UPI001D06BD01|nr:protein lingerer isoform X3 [Coccinella septempunctata]XP_044747575.1 protein lingerer isoform X3 [Coccinella septempunctata]XP_044747576.1 protein lingerer isoform X3 [Coccinella septempunctata]XP_044747577.1 protein lingerer isoform X3 [Coccinella septempunctata]